MLGINRGAGPLIGLVALVAAGCSGEEQASEVQARVAPPPMVVVAKVATADVPVMRDFVARTRAVDTVEVHARVEAVLASQDFEEGTVVTEGQVLYRLDPRTYTANVSVAKARLEQAKASLKLAEEQVSVRAAQAGLVRTQATLKKAQQDVARLQPLAEKDAVPRQDLDTALAAEEVAQAEVDAQQATLENARIQENVGLLLARASVEEGEAGLQLAELDLSYCTIESPITGMVGRTMVDAGNLVGRGQTTALTTISSVDPMYVTFAISEEEYLVLEARRREQVAKNAMPEFSLLLADDSVYEHTGSLAFGERTIDESTGTLEIVASFPNPDGRLRPGQFGRCRIQVNQLDGAVLIPQRAVMEQQGAKFAFVVGDDGLVAMRGLEIKTRYEDSFVVTKGLEAGETVIVEGLLKARPGQPVQVTDRPVSAEPAARPGDE